MILSELAGIKIFGTGGLGKFYLQNQSTMSNHFQVACIAGVKTPWIFPVGIPMNHPSFITDNR
jgi:hypothetical protein